VSKIDRANRTNRTVRQLRRAIAKRILMWPVTNKAVQRHRRGNRGHESSGYAK
jgi:hypothetical protein